MFYSHFWKMKVLLLAQIVALAAFTTVVGYPASNGRIIGGDTAGRALPYVVSIQSDDSHLCGGFIYNEKWVITVASCVFERASSSLTVSINDYKFINLNDPGEEKVTVYRVITNDEFNYTTLENDIALLELSTTLELKTIVENYNATANIGPSCVRYDEVPSYVSGTVPGWGLIEPDGVATTTLHTGYVEVVKSDQCNEPVYPDFTSSTMICAASQTAPGATGADGAVTVPCTGDEGSPLVVVGDGDEPVVVGLFSYNDECNAAVPSVFTRVSVYYAWIGKTAGAQPNNCFVNPAPIVITAKDNYTF